MGLILFFVEKVLTAVLLSILIFLATLSYSSGKFPPSKDQIYQSFNLLKSVYKNAVDVKTLQGQMPENPSLNQIYELQKLTLKRTELGLNLMNQYKLFQNQPVHPVVAAKIEAISRKLDEAGIEMNSLSEDIQKMRSTVPATPTR